MVASGFEPVAAHDQGVVAPGAGGAVDAGAEPAERVLELRLAGREPPCCCLLLLLLELDRLLAVAVDRLLDLLAVRRIGERDGLVARRVALLDLAVGVEVEGELGVGGEGVLIGGDDLLRLGGAGRVVEQDEDLHGARGGRRRSAGPAWSCSSRPTPARPARDPVWASALIDDLAGLRVTRDPLLGGAVVGGDQVARRRCRSWGSASTAFWAS